MVLMTVSQKCQYALRAIFELAKRPTDRPTSIAEIATKQAIPRRFLELILNELRQGGFVESRRGVQGGYLLAVSPASLSAGEIIRFVDGPLAPAKCVGDQDDCECPMLGNCAFMDLWKRARDAVADVYDNTTFQDLLDAERAGAEKAAPNYCI
jgi:Rrf2 family transcriptional regulator, cysteine metabolism repressor